VLVQQAWQQYGVCRKPDSGPDHRQERYKVLTTRSGIDWPIEAGNPVFR